MKIPDTKHKQVTYRNGEHGILLTTKREGTRFSIMTLTNDNRTVIHHHEDGTYLMNDDEHKYDIVDVK